MRDDITFDQHSSIGYAATKCGEFGGLTSSNRAALTQICIELNKIFDIEYFHERMPTIAVLSLLLGRRPDNLSLSLMSSSPQQNQKNPSGKEDAAIRNAYRWLLASFIFIISAAGLALLV